MNINFKNQNILITGGTKGIGKKLVQDFTRYGGEVWFTGRDESINSKRYFCIDFQNQKRMRVFLERISKIDFDVVINNAGTNKIGNLENYDVEDYEKIINLNLTSCFKLTKTVVPRMIKKKYGRIVNISSISSEISMPLRSAYCSSKFGLLGLTKASAVELAKHNILINAVGPGVTQTELTKNVLGESKMNEIARNVPIGRLATVEDVSKVVLFMSSKHNSYMVGQNIIVDGGYTCV
jgi:3-oxoacyl-[acyl-carrier protein] reductase